VHGARRGMYDPVVSVEGIEPLSGGFHACPNVLSNRFSEGRVRLPECVPRQKEKQNKEKR